jgi:hypothetical protein
MGFSYELVADCVWGLSIEQPDQRIFLHADGLGWSATLKDLRRELRI